MVDALLSKHQFNGYSKKAVLELLGEPEQTNYFQDYDLVYWLGPERGFISIDSEWLVFKLDADLHVREYHIVRD